mgnify:CR=1 FL=1
MTVPSPPDQPTPAELRQKTRIAFLNATALYILAYLTADTAYRLVTVLTARQLRIPSLWRLSRVQFLIPNAAWWRTAVVTVYGTGPLLCLMLALVAGLWFWQRQRFRRGLLKQYLLWLLLHGLNLFFGALVADTITQSGFWYVPSWVFLAGNAVNVAVAAVFGLVLVVLGYVLAPLFLLSHDSRTLMRYENRRRLLLATLFGPWLAGSAVLALAKLPELTVNEQLHFATLLLALAPLALASGNELFEFTVEEPRKTRAAWGLAVVALLLLVGLRVVLGPGVQFG